MFSSPIFPHPVSPRGQCSLESSRTIQDLISKSRDCDLRIPGMSTAAPGRCFCIRPLETVRRVASARRRLISRRMEPEARRRRDRRTAQERRGERDCRRRLWQFAATLLRSRLPRSPEAVEAALRGAERCAGMKPTGPR